MNLLEPEGCVETKGMDTKSRLVQSSICTLLFFSGIRRLETYAVRVARKRDTGNAGEYIAGGVKLSSNSGPQALTCAGCNQDA
jgi:hypothetical protein